MGNLHTRSDILPLPSRFFTLFSLRKLNRITKSRLRKNSHTAFLTPFYSNNIPSAYSSTKFAFAERSTACICATACKQRACNRSSNNSPTAPLYAAFPSILVHATHSFGNKRIFPAPPIPKAIPPSTRNARQAIYPHSCSARGSSLFLYSSYLKLRFLPFSQAVLQCSL